MLRFAICIRYHDKTINWFRCALNSFFVLEIGLLTTEFTKQKTILKLNIDACGGRTRLGNIRSLNKISYI